MSILQIFLISLSSLLLAPDRESVDIVFAGDAMQHQRQLDAARRADGTYDYSPYYREIKPYIESADYAVVNLETPLGGAPYSGYPMFCAPDSYLTALTDAGFDLILTANNHMLDRRDRGLRRTVATLESAGVPYVGAYRNKAHRDSVIPVIKDIGGFKVAFLNYTYGTNGIAIQGDVVADYINRPLMKEDVEKSRAKGAEIVVVCVHWGEEYKLLPNAAPRSLADYLTDLGVDLIIGGHPHVIQPMEIRRSEKHDKDVFLCYSLGNFVSAMRTTDTRGGALARVTLARDSIGRAVVRDASYRMVFTVPPGGGNRDFYLIPAEKVAPAHINQAREAFVRNAMRIFNAHNAGVPLDTLSISAYDR